MAKFNIKLNKEQQKMLAAGLLVFVGGGAVYVKMFWIPTSHRIAEAATKIEELDGEIKKALGAAARRDKMQRELAQVQQQAADAEKRLPRIKDVPAIIDTLARLARKSKVDILNFAPGGVSAQGFFEEIPYTLSITGSYHDVGRFLASLALEERIYNVRGVSYSLSGGVEGPPVLSVSFTLISYRYLG